MGAVLTVMSQVSISTLTVFYWSLHRDHMSMGYAWICGYVALGLVMLLLILILVSCCCTLIPEEEHRIPIEHDVEKAEKFARWVLILLFLPALAFQMVIHSDDGGVLKDKAFRDAGSAKIYRYFYLCRKLFSCRLCRADGKVRAIGKNVVIYFEIG